MRRKAFSIVGIMFFFSVLSMTVVYGPMQRTFAAFHRVVSVSSPSEIRQIWDSAGVRGRAAVLFTRHLNGELEGNVFQEDTYIQMAMHRGIVRVVYYVVPDSVWNEVIYENRFSDWILPHKPTASGFAMLFEGGRVNVLPLSRFWPQAGEKALVVLEPAIWSKDDLSHIASLIKSKSLGTDLLALVRGSSSDMKIFSAVLSPVY